MNKRAILLVIDSLGVGYMADTAKERPDDVGANTFFHILDVAWEIDIPNLEKLGINKVLRHKRLKDIPGLASYGTLRLQHYGADSYAGHQEIMGSIPVKPQIKPFAAFAFDVRKALEGEGYTVEILKPDTPYLVVDGLIVVADNIETDPGQIYNVTASLDEVSFEKILRIGRIVRSHVKVSRVIALGGRNVPHQQIMDSIETNRDGLIGVNCPKSGVYREGYNVCHLGYGIEPDEQISSILIKSGRQVILIGKMQDVISCEGARKVPAVETELVMKEIIEAMEQQKNGFIAATVQETDLAGHAQDADGYAKHISMVDRYLSVIISEMTEDDLLIITADHGNDPTIGFSQHTREKTFVLVYGKRLKAVDLGERESLSDTAATIADYFGVRLPENGKSFFEHLKLEN